MRPLRCLFRKILLLAFSSFVFLLISCGSDSDSDNNGSGGISYSGSTTPAVINSNNAEALGKGSADAILAADKADDASVVRSARKNHELSLVTNLSKSLVDSYRSNASRSLTSRAAVPGECGGSANIPDGSDLNNVTITYTNFCVSSSQGNIIVDGTVVFKQTQTSFSIQYIDVTVTQNGTTETINATFSCNADLTSCSYSSDYVGTDGRTYRVDNFEISGNPSSGFTVISGRVYDPDFGYVDISTQTPVTYNCPDGRPDAGSIVCVGASGTSASITFNNCSSFTYCYNDGSGEICNNGTW